MDPEENKDKDKVEEVVEEAVKAGKQFVKQKLKKILIPILMKLLPLVMVLLVTVSAIMYVVEAITGIGEAFSNLAHKITNGSIQLDGNEFLEEINKQLEEVGISKSNLYLGTEVQADFYLLKYYKAAMATQLPYMAGSKTKGIVHIKRTSTTVEDARELQWVTYDSLENMAKEKRSNAENYFSLDESGNLCVIVANKTIVNGSETDAVLNIQKIPYQNVIAQYAVPFKYLMVMQQITQNAGYVSAISDMIVDDKRIDFTNLDTQLRSKKT